LNIANIVKDSISFLVDGERNDNLAWIFNHIAISHSRTAKIQVTGSRLCLFIAVARASRATQTLITHACKPALRVAHARQSATPIVLHCSFALSRRFKDG